MRADFIRVLSTRLITKYFAVAIGVQREKEAGTSLRNLWDCTVLILLNVKSRLALLT